ncbi:MAG: alpha/beta hydrolase [Bacteriovorax sp.]|nr:alpha/beta hydrolase [Bacteriovorax sp.]
MKTILLTLFLTLINAPLHANEDCRKNNREAFLKINNSLYAEYSQLDSKQSVTEDKKAVWIEGDPKVNKALFVAHGFMGSPGEMMFLAQPFIKKGWTVVGFLIPGHGSTYKIANEFKNMRWIKEMKTQLNLVTDCFNEVRAVGFSTGGLLLHYYALTQPIPASLKSLHLVSPFFIQRFGGFFDRILGFFVNGIGVDKAYFFSHFRDLKVMTIDRKYYHQNIPVDSGLQVKELGQKVYNMKAQPQIKIPVQLFLSEGDMIVDTNSTKEVINRDYENVKLFWYKGEEPHHLMAPSVSRVSEDVQKLIFNF